MAIYAMLIAYNYLYMCCHNDGLTHWLCRSTACVEVKSINSISS